MKNAYSNVFKTVEHKSLGEQSEIQAADITFKMDTVS